MFNIQVLTPFLATLPTSKQQPSGRKFHGSKATLAGKLREYVDLLDSGYEK